MTTLEPRLSPPYPAGAYYSYYRGAALSVRGIDWTIWHRQFIASKTVYKFGSLIPTLQKKRQVYRTGPGIRFE